MRKAFCALPVLGLYFGLSQPAQAAEITRVATAFEKDNRFDFHFGVSYDFNYKRAAILREWSPGDGGNIVAKDLIYSQQRHIITPSMEFGLWNDLALYVTLPIVASDQRFYEFDQRADDCVFGEDVSPGNPEANCVNKNNSTTIRDSILPRDGFDAQTPGNPFGQFGSANTQRIFNGPTRRGLDQLHVGLKYGILSQRKHSHLPDWIIAFEGRFAVGRPMTFSRDIEVDEPDGNSRVGRGIHEIGLWTALSRRYRFLDPFFSAYWRQSLRASGSQFEDLSNLGAQDKVQPQSQTGVRVGAEIVPWERKAKSQKVSVILQGTADLHYGGRGYSEVWELLADSPALVGPRDPGDPTSVSGCDQAQVVADYAVDPSGQARDQAYLDGTTCSDFNGITDIQDYGTFGLDFALNFHFNKFARMNLGADLNTDTRHFLTFADRGKSAGSGSDDDVVEPGTDEVNPVRRDVIDNVGRRYVIDDVLNVYAYLNFMLTF